MYSAVGRSTTTASTWPCLSAVTTAFESSNTFGCLDGLIVAVTASRLVVPIWTPIWASASSARLVAAAAADLFCAITRLRRRVVRVREVDRALALLVDRDLVDVEVEVLRPRLVGGVERHDRPLDLALVEAELAGDRVRDRALEALAVRRVVVLEVGRERRLVGADRELAGGLEIEVGLLARRLRGRRGRLVVGRGIVVGIAAGGDRERRGCEQRRRAGEGSSRRGA